MNDHLLTNMIYIFAQRWKPKGQWNMINSTGEFSKVVPLVVKGQALFI